MLDLIEMTDYEETRRSFKYEVPEFYNFGFDVIEKRALENDKVAFYYVARDGESIETHKFSDLNLAANRAANMLRGLGVAKDDRAIVVLPRIPAFYEVIVGTIKTGVIAMPGTMLLTAKDLAYRINRAEAKLVIVTEEHADRIDEIKAECPSLVQLILVGGSRDGWVDYGTACASASDQLSRDDVEPTRADEDMLIYFTSGTTAYPKMVPRDHAYPLAHTITGRYWMDLGESDIHWTLSDTGWAKAAWGIFPQWQLGAAVVLYDAGAGFDTDAHLHLIEQLRVTTFCAPPTVFRLFAQIELSKYDLSSIRHTLSAGEPLNPEAMRAWRAATGHNPHDGYGQTETVNLVANYPAIPVRPGSMGKAVPGFDIQIVDDDGNVQPEHEVGHIAVRMGEQWPPGLFKGYYDDEAANAESFRNGFYYTGDTGMRDEDDYIWFVGRSDDLILSASYRISPFEVESALAEHAAIVESAVIGKDDAVRGQIVKAYVVLAAGHEPSNELTTDIQEFVKKLTAPYKYPREIAYLEALPKTISGKIRRVELREGANKAATAAE